MDKINPKITVYITNYNYGCYIGKAIKSVLNQTIQDFELIIIDDGSTDNSKQIIEKFSKNSKINIVFQKNKGLNVSNNIALKLSRGKYLVRLDADDYFHPDALLTLSTILERDPSVGLVFPDYYIVDNNGEIIECIKRHNFDNEVTMLDQPAHGACTMIRKEFLNEVGGYDENFKCQDGFDLWIKFISKYRVTNINKPLFYYRQHGCNLTSNELKIIKTRMAIKKQYIDINQKCLPKTLGIIPVRHASKDLILEQLGGVSLLERKIRCALECDELDQVVVVSSDYEIKEIVDRVGDHRCIYLERPEKFSRFNSSLYETITAIFKNPSIKEKGYEAFVVLAPEYPFLISDIIGASIRTSVIFNADSVISVRTTNDSLYTHDGHGLKRLQEDGKTKYERDSVYIAKGGVSFSNYNSFEKHKCLPNGRVGHVHVCEEGAFEINGELDFKIAQFLLDKTKDKKNKDQVQASSVAI